MSNINEVARVFDNTAPRYDDILAGYGWPVNDMLSAKLIGTGPVHNALDPGAGTGLSTRVILDTVQPHSLVAVDVSEAMLERLRQRCNDPRLVVAKMAIDQFLAATQSKYDLVVAMGLLHFLQEPSQTISAVARVLNDRGRFIFTYDPYLPGHPIHGERQTTYDLTIYRNAPAEIEESLGQSGLEIVSDQCFAPQPEGNTAYRSHFVVARKLGHSPRSVAQT
jgi:predicted TPR repeat methyltransferase